MKKGFVIILNIRIYFYDKYWSCKKKLIVLYDCVKMYEVFKMLFVYSYIDF